MKFLSFKKVLEGQSDTHLSITNKYGAHLLPYIK